MDKKQVIELMEECIWLLDELMRSWNEGISMLRRYHDPETEGQVTPEKAAWIREQMIKDGVM